MPTNKPRIDGPGMVEPRDGRLSKRLVDVIHDLFDRAYSAQTTATAAQTAADSAASTSITITGQNGVQVFGDGTSGFVIDGQPAHVMARISLGF
jgi:hypothetical protein